MPSILCPLCGKRAQLVESASQVSRGVPRYHTLGASYDCESGRHTVEVVVLPRRPGKAPPPLPPSGAAA